MKKDEAYAVISVNYTNDFQKYYEWASSLTRKFTGQFATLEDATASIPDTFKVIKVQVDSSCYEICR